MGQAAENCNESNRTSVRRRHGEYPGRLPGHSKARVLLAAARDGPAELSAANAALRERISEHERAEAALRATEERFRLLVDGVRDYAIFLLDAEGRVSSWNRGAERLKGYAADEIIGRHFSCFYPEE